MSATAFQRRRREIAKEKLEQAKEVEQPKQVKQVNNLSEKNAMQLREMATEQEITGYTRMKKEELIEALKGGD